MLNQRIEIPLSRNQLKIQVVLKFIHSTIHLINNLLETMYSLLQETYSSGTTTTKRLIILINSALGKV